MNRLSNCPICFKLFSFDGQNDLCPECSTKEDQDYMKVRRFLSDNPGATPAYVANKTGIQAEVILHLIRNKRLICS